MCVYAVQRFGMVHLSDLSRILPERGTVRALLQVLLLTQGLLILSDRPLICYRDAKLFQDWGFDLLKSVVSLPSSVFSTSSVAA